MTIELKESDITRDALESNLNSEITNGSIDRAYELLIQNDGLIASGRGGHTPLTYVISQMSLARNQSALPHYIALFELLLTDRPGDIDVETKAGLTALHVASRGGNVAV
ncbi:MAG: hypothetical protein V3V61_02655, partial [Gammaproteobacteria bacterium]